MMVDISLDYCIFRHANLNDVELEESCSVLNGSIESVSSIAISPDGKYLSVGSNHKTVRLWNIIMNKEVATLKGHSD